MLAMGHLKPFGGEFCAVCYPRIGLPVVLNAAGHDARIG